MQDNTTVRAEQAEEEIGTLRALLATARADLDKMTLNAETSLQEWWLDICEGGGDETDRADHDKAILAVEHARHTMEQIDAALADSPR